MRGIDFSSLFKEGLRALIHNASDNFLFLVLLRKPLLITLKFSYCGQGCSFLIWCFKIWDFLSLPLWSNTLSEMRLAVSPTNLFYILGYFQLFTTMFKLLAILFIISFILVSCFTHQKAESCFIRISSIKSFILIVHKGVMFFRLTSFNTGGELECLMPV